ncbi:MAG TPA: DNA polymerase III subunit gamma/tau [Anaerolineaceae bacterium]
MSQSLYRKWRPHEWDEVVGQDPVVTTLRNAILSSRVGHAYLFGGPRGTGKTTTARLLAKAVNCLNPDPGERPCNQCDHCQAVNEGRFLDLIEIDAASNTSVEDVRDLRDKVNFSPNQGKYKVYIIDEVHMLSTPAFNALLKTLEEPPAHVIFILATTEMHKIPATVLSRCQRYEFRRVPVPIIVSLLQDICKKEALESEPEALTLIARQATGSLRDAISLLDQLASTGKTISLAKAQEVLGTATSQVVIDLVSAILDHDPASGLNGIHTALDAGTDPRQFARQVVDFLRNLLLIHMGNEREAESTPEVRDLMRKLAGGFDTPRLLAAIRAFNTAALDQRAGSWQPGLPIELAFAEAVDPGAVISAEPARPAQTLAPRVEAPLGPPLVQPRAETPVQKAPPEHPAPVQPQHTPTPPSSKPEAARVAPAKTAVAAPYTEGSAAAGSGITLQTVNQNWRQVLNLLREQKYFQTEAFLRSSRLLGIKESTLILGLNSEFSKSKMESGDHLEATRSALSRVLGVEMQVRCVVSTGKLNDKMLADLDIDNDGMVGTALRDLGGEVVDVQ